MQLQSKLALVTGGSRGIGFQVSRILIENGAHVLAVARDTEALAKAQEALRNLQVLRADVSDAADNDAVAAWVASNWGKLDVLVNNAGVSPGVGAAMMTAPDDEFERTFRINVFGPYLCTQRLLPLLLKSDDPRVVNVGSTSGVMSSRLRGVYAVSKTALHALTIAMANELKGTVAVNALSPGWVRTDMAPDAPGDPRSSAEAALRLLGQPRDVTGRLFHDRSELGWGSQD